MADKNILTCTVDDDTLATLIKVAGDEDRSKNVQAARVLRQWARSMESPGEGIGATSVPQADEAF